MGFRFRRMALLAVFAVFALDGCGDDAPPAGQDSRTPLARSPAEQQVAARVRAFLAAMDERDDSRACAMMTRKLQHAINVELRVETQPGTCQTRAADVYSPAKAPGNENARITNVRIAGDRATVTVTARSTSELGTGQVESDVFLVRRPAHWLVANF
jgi:hypothetical protein